MTSIDINKMLRAGSIPEQLRTASEQLCEETLFGQNGSSGVTDIEASIEASGRAYRICRDWQKRFGWALQAEIPAWQGLAGLRIIPDYTVSPDKVDAFFASSCISQGSYSCPCHASWRQHFSGKNPLIETIEDARFFYILADNAKETICPDIDDRNRCIAECESKLAEHLCKPIQTVEDAHLACVLYLDKGLKFGSGKLYLAPGGPAEKYFLEKIQNSGSSCETQLGGQAGNILWLWHHIGAEPYAYAPYGLGNVLVALARKISLDLNVFSVVGGKLGFSRLTGSDETALPSPPTGGSVVFYKGGERILFQFWSFRVLNSAANPRQSWNKVQLRGPDGKSLLQADLQDDADSTWPMIPLFAECSIQSNQLVIQVLKPEDLKLALAGRVECAILGGIDSLFAPKGWIAKDQTGQLRARLRALLVEQLKALASCGLRIGVELSGYPSRAYAELLRELCAQEIVVALGINGEDELPKTVGNEALAQHIDELWLDPATVHHALSEEVKAQEADAVKEAKRHRQGHFEYVTYLRARKLAEFMQARTLYVHTTSLDFILRKNADPGALLHAQHADMMGKGYVIAALLLRAYHDTWYTHLKKMTPAVSPVAMVQLGRFARHFAHFEKHGDARMRLLQHGYWLAQSQDQYSVAVAPVMWPAVNELPSKLNTTGAGDMTFGAFFFLGGV